MMTAREGPPTDTPPDAWADHEPAWRAERSQPLRPAMLPAESAFYQRYTWCLDAFPSAGHVVHRLRAELASLGEELEPWQRDEVALNVFLLCCALADTVDDHLAGREYDFSGAETVLPWARHLTGALQRLLDAGRRRGGWRQRGFCAWRRSWDAAVDALLRASLVAPRLDDRALAAARAELSALLAREWPPALMAPRAKVPAAFRTQDLTHHDILELAGRFAAAFPDQARPRLVVGRRTTGSYFAPLLRAALAARGYEAVQAVTLRLNQSLASWESAALARAAAEGAQVVILDEPAATGCSLARMVDVVRRAGVPAADVTALVPVHPTRRDWRRSDEALPLSRIHVIALAPEEWRKQKRLEPAVVQERLQAYFRGLGYAEASVLASPAAERFNRQLHRVSDEKFHTRLKRIYHVRLADGGGRIETRFVLAKSVGWGWLGYHAFLAARGLSDFVPPVLGLREGMLFAEWLPQSDSPALPHDRERLGQQVAAYVAARVRSLGLEADPGPGLDRRQQNGSDLLARTLSRAYGKRAAGLKRARIRHELSKRPCPVPTFIDGRMRLEEWIRGAASFLKTDFEHHGMGKTELNVTDPAYDLAEAVLHLKLSAVEEQQLLQRYRDACGDGSVEERLFLHKLLAGTAAASAALLNVRDPRLRPRHEEFSRTYVAAGEFLTLQTAEACGRLWPAPAPEWRSPLVVLDMDEVLDRGTFGYPSPTAAGLRALSLLHAHGYAVGLSSARTLGEVQAYCRAYRCVGGVAEYGGVVWDQVHGRARVLVAAEAVEDLQRLGKALRRVPGVFVDQRYRYALRAYTYGPEGTVPLPAALVQGMIADAGLDRLTVHATAQDTAVRGREVDTGKGLHTLLALGGQQAIETIAVANSEASLALVSAAGCAYVSGRLASRGVTGLLGCRVGGRSRQPEPLQSVRSILHGGGGECARCEAGRRRPAGGLFWSLLEAADRRPLASLVSALADPMSLQTFVR